MRIIVLGYIIRGPIGGMAWHHLQYLLGLKQLGHDVYFFEDSDNYPSCYNPVTNSTGSDASYGLQFVSSTLGSVGLEGGWTYYDAHTGTWSGPIENRALQICETADVLLNVSSVNPIRDWFSKIPIRVLIDTDPVFTQIRHIEDQSAKEMAARHTAFFSFGANVNGRASLPNDGFNWIPTRQPIALESWPVTAGPKHGSFTTVMQWESYPPAHYGGRVFGTKSMSFKPYEDLPRKTTSHLELAVGNPASHLSAHGWKLSNPLEVARDIWSYQSFIKRSKAEFSVAKHGYVETRSGWFSERSANYLASGRPVVVQDTGFTDWLPSGEGVLAFSSPDEALTGIDQINARYESHCASARQIAAEYFDSDVVLTDLLNTATAGPASKSRANHD